MTRVPFPVRALPSVAYRVWFTPPPVGAKAAARHADALEGLTPLRVPLRDGGELAGFEVGTGPLVLALHGWGGRAAQMVPIAERLAGDGFRVVAVDLPGHSGGVTTDVKEVAAAVRELPAALGDPEVVIAHSFGAIALRLALAPRVPPATVLLAPALKVSDVFGVFSERARLLPWTRASLWRRLEAWDPEVFPMLDSLCPDSLPGSALLIVHDPADQDTSFAVAAEYAELRPGTTFLPVEGVGHHGILSDPGVLERVSRFVARRAQATAIAERG